MNFPRNLRSLNLAFLSEVAQSRCLHLFPGWGSLANFRKSLQVLPSSARLGACWDFCTSGPAVFMPRLSQRLRFCGSVSTWKASVGSAYDVHGALGHMPFEVGPLWHGFVQLPQCRAAATACTLSLPASLFDLRPRAVCRTLASSGLCARLVTLLPESTLESQRFGSCQRVGEPLSSQYDNLKAKGTCQQFPCDSSS